MKIFKNSKGFTLIELLAVIVILGVIMIIAVPSVASNITNSKKDSFVTSAKSFIDGVRNGANSADYDLPVELNEVVVVWIRNIPLDKGGKTSPFGKAWIHDQTYVVIKNTSSDANNPRYTYFFAGQDVGGNRILLAAEADLSRSKVVKTGDIVKAPTAPGEWSATIPGSTDTRFNVISAYSSES